MTALAFFPSFTVTKSRVAFDLGAVPRLLTQSLLFPLSASATLTGGGGGGGNAGVVTSVALVWASQDKEKVSVPLPHPLPGISSLGPDLVRSLESGRYLGDVPFISFS